MGGHAPLKPTKYRSIHEIPDSMIPQWSKRDPNNPVYKTRAWVNFKKNQILFSQNDGVPIYMRTARWRATYYFAWAGTISMFFYNIYTYNKHTSKK